MKPNDKNKDAVFLQGSKPGKAKKLKFSSASPKSKFHLYYNLATIYANDRNQMIVEYRFTLLSG